MLPRIQTASPDTLTQGTALDTTQELLINQLQQTTQLIRQGEYLRLVDRATEMLLAFVPRLVSALLILLAFWIIYRSGTALLRRLLSRSSRITLEVEQLFIKVFKVTVIAFAAIMALDQLGINVTTLIAGLGIAGLALGFAARETIENFIAGVTIIFDEPFRVGDYVELGDLFGRVEELGLRSTRLRTLDNELVTVPNALLITRELVNHTRTSALRVRIPFGIAYKEDPEEARKVVLALTEGDDRLHPDHPPQVVATQLGPSSVDMELHLFLRDPHVEVPIRAEYTEKIFMALRKADIEIPFPHRQLFIDGAKGFEPLVERLMQRKSPPSPSP